MTAVVPLWVVVLSRFPLWQHRAPPLHSPPRQSMSWQLSRTCILMLLPVVVVRTERKVLVVLARKAPPTVAVELYLPALIGQLLGTPRVWSIRTTWGLLKTVRVRVVARASRRVLHLVGRLRSLVGSRGSRGMVVPWA